MPICSIYNIKFSTGKIVKLLSRDFLQCGLGLLRHASSSHGIKNLLNCIVLVKNIIIYRYIERWTDTSLHLHIIIYV
jgi:hypothetical protein